MKDLKFLKVARIVFLVFAWISLLFGVIGAIGIFLTGGAQTIAPDGTTVASIPKSLGIIPLIQGGLGFFVFFSLSKIISVLCCLKKCCDKPAV